MFHEDIPIAGTDMTLHYASNRVKGYKTLISIPASGASVPSSLKKIIVQMNLAGRNFETTLDPLANQKAEFVWDGLDHRGRTVNGTTVADIKIGFVYNAYYYSARNDIPKAFAQAGNNITGVRGRQDITSWKQSSMEINSQRAVVSGVFGEGWTLSQQNYLGPGDFNTLFKGDGTIIKGNIEVITTVAGNGIAGYSGDGGSAAQAVF